MSKQKEKTNGSRLSKKKTNGNLNMSSSLTAGIKIAHWNAKLVQ